MPSGSARFDMGSARWASADLHAVQAFAALDCADLAAIIAYLKQVPSVDRELPPTHSV